MEPEPGRVSHSHASALHGARLRRTARWLSAGVVALILYGCLFPFDFRAGASFDLAECLTRLRFLRPSRGDLVANLLLFMPLGLCLVLAMPGRMPPAAAVALATAAGTAISFGIEMAQFFYAERISSLTDVLLNAIGTLCGAAAGAVYSLLGSGLRVPGMIRGAPEPVPCALVGLWITYRLAPFVPAIDWQKWKEALKPLLLSPSLTLFDVARHAAGWLVVALALRRLWRPEVVLPAFAVLATCMVCGLVVVHGTVLTASEIAALALVAPAVAWLQRSGAGRGVAAVAALLLLAVIVAEGLKPFEWLDEPQGFSWVPFQASLGDSLELNYMVFFKKCFLYLAVVWLLAGAGLSVAAASTVEAAVLAMVEAVQMWLPGRSAEITDPLLALAAGAMMAVLARAGAPADRPGGLRARGSA